MAAVGPERLAEGFPVGSSFHPWGAEVDAVRADYERQVLEAGAPPTRSSPYNRSFLFRCAGIFGIPAVTCTVGVMYSGLVAYVSFELPALPGLCGPEGLARLRPVLDDSLGASVDTDVAARTSRARWRFGPADVNLITHDRLATLAMEERRLIGDDDALTAGSFSVHCDEAFLLAPAVARLDAEPPPVWATSPGERELVPVPGLFRPVNVDRRLTTEPGLRRPPAWVVEGLPADHVVIWTHPSGWWGMADSVQCCAFSEAVHEFTHHRTLPGRHAGTCSLWPFGAAPGPHGLDFLAQRLMARGQVVRLQQTVSTD